MHEEVAAESRAEILPLLAGGPDTEGIVGSVAAEGSKWPGSSCAAATGPRDVVEQHPEVPREQVVATAMNSLWIGFERVSEGEGWRPDAVR